MERVGVLDLGTNTFRLLIASRSEKQIFQREIIDRKIVRIGEGFVQTGKISDGPIIRAQKALDEFYRLLHKHQVVKVAGVATGIFREAENAEKVIERLFASFGFPLRVISGEEEGTYTLKGIQAGLDLNNKDHYLIIDIGGGSTEFVRFSSSETTIWSIPIGVVYLKEKFQASVYAEPGAYDEMAEWIDRSLDKLFTDMDRDPLMDAVGTGGTITTLSHMDLKLKTYLPEKIHGSRLTQEKVNSLVQEARGLEMEEIRKRYHLEQGRADLILYGGALVQRIFRRLPRKMLQVSDYGLLEGVAMEMLEG